MILGRGTLGQGTLGRRRKIWVNLRSGASLLNIHFSRLRDISRVDSGSANT